MTLSVAADNRIACAVQLYDEWGGYYVLQRLDNGAYVDVRRLSREEAMTYRIVNDEALKLVFETIAPNPLSHDMAR